MLAHQRLDVYQCSIRLLTLTTQLSRETPKGFSPLAEQLRRASLSIPLNIGEGVGRRSRQDAARFFGIARGSAMECGAIVDVLGAIASSNSADRERATTLIVRIVEMLTKMCQRAC